MSLDTPAKIAVIGAGPIGLEAALYARFLGYDVDIYERGHIAENVLRRGHVKMFTPFGMNSSPLGLAALRAQDPSWQQPDPSAILTGREWADRYLIPLAQSDLLSDGLREQTEVVAVGRAGLLKGELVDDEARADTDLRLLVRAADGTEHIATADAVIDASGTYGNHNWLGDGGIPAVGEIAAEPHIEYGLPDVLGADREQYGGRHTLVIGSGHSAATSVVALAELARQVPETWITWITRPAISGPADTIDAASAADVEVKPVSEDPNDPFPERARLARSANPLADGESEHVTYWPKTTVESIAWHPGLSQFSVRLNGLHAGSLDVDRVIANVGYRPDNRLFRELQVAECYATGAPTKLGQALASAKRAGGSRANSALLNAEMLLTHEPDFYILGAKSYGRDSQFLVADGFEQIRLLFTVIGDRADLNLYASAPSMR